MINQQNKKNNFSYIKKKSSNWMYPKESYFFISNVISKLKNNNKISLELIIENFIIELISEYGLGSVLVLKKFKIYTTKDLNRILINLKKSEDMPKNFFDLELWRIEYRNINIFNFVNKYVYQLVNVL